MEHYILENKKIKRVSLLEAAAWLESEEGHKNRRVAKTNKDGVEVSTVFLWVDHSFSSEGPPILFETMVFGGEHNEHCERYATYQEAEEGHKRICEMVFGPEPREIGETIYEVTHRKIDKENIR